jgi:GR25 family glycosyltransferase involved in LPS biosynthesis
MDIYILVSLIIILFVILYKKNIENFENKIYKIQDIIDQIYIINMDKDKNRMKNLDKKMKNLGLNYNRITGVDGNKVYKKYKTKYNTKLRPGQLGCLLSHQNVLKDAIKNNYTNILVLEDDIIFHKNFHDEFKKKYKYLIDREKNVDLLYLGCSQKHKWKDIKLNRHYYNSKKIDGTFAMIINKILFKPILEKSSKLEKPIDRILYYYFQEKKKSFCFNPNIITVKLNTFSNTENIIFNDNKYYKKNKIDINNFDNL